MPFLEMIGLPESFVGLLRDSSSGYALTAYAMYKVSGLNFFISLVMSTDSVALTCPGSSIYFCDLPNLSFDHHSKM